VPSSRPPIDLTADVVLLGAGPAGLGGALALTRAGRRVVVLEAADCVGGMCVTDRVGDFAFDLGGHILFVHDAQREAWLRELLGPDLHRVERPVACMVDGVVRRGRYFDQPGPVAMTPHDVPDPTTSAAQFLAGLFGEVPADLRRYLEKVDGIPLERITATRARKLLVEQYAPDGFWYPAGGVGQLMDAMVRAIRAGGGSVLTGTAVSRIVTEDARVAGVRAEGPDGAIDVTTSAVVAGVPAGLVTRLVETSGPDAGTPLPARAAAVASIAVDAPRLTEEPWIQVDDRRIPFARLSEPKNWSPRLAPADRTLVSCEVYCAPTDDDPWWPMDDDALGDACRSGLVDLGLLAPDAGTELVRVARRPRAWTVVDVDHVDESLVPARALAEVGGLVIAQGGDVVNAIEAGERAAHEVVASRG